MLHSDIAAAPARYATPVTLRLIGWGTIGLYAYAEFTCYLDYAYHRYLCTSGGPCFPASPFLALLAYVFLGGIAVFLFWAASRAASTASLGRARAEGEVVDRTLDRAAGACRWSGYLSLALLAAVWLFYPVWTAAALTVLVAASAFLSLWVAGRLRRRDARAATMTASALSLALGLLLPVCGDPGVVASVLALAVGLGGLWLLGLPGVGERLGGPAR